MLQTLEPAQTTWRREPFRASRQSLPFGQTYEDPRIELGAFPPRSRVFSIAGAGDTARALAAAGHRVTAVDISPAQLAYAESRAAGSPAHAGTAERLLEFGRNLAKLAGWSRTKLEAFVDLSDGAEQIEFWDRQLDTTMWRAAVDMLLAPCLLSLCYRSPFLASLPRDFGPRLRKRLRRGWARHSNCGNPFAALLLLGRPLPEPGTAVTPIRFVRADAADYLESCPPGAFDAFSLSNISDGASLEYQRRLQAAVNHAAAPEAVVVRRSFAEPGSSTCANRAALDRSLLWGMVEVSHAGAAGTGGASCCIC
jgi:S-adenosylmethionine:diacylglycerol 3-amino-3-carboxypropyl transferase